MTDNSERVLILDFGSQYTQLIARRVREHSVYSQIVSHDTPAAELAEMTPRGIIMSGGPASVYAEGAPRCDPAIFDLGVPILGICYGLQVTCETLGGRVEPAESREYGRTECKVLDRSDLFVGLPEQMIVWMSHGDQVQGLSDDFVPLAQTKTCPYAAARHKTRPIYGVQFHPEVTHTPRGSEILRNFLYHVCECRGTWRMSSYIDETIRDTRERVGSARVVCGLSGGVDSSVVALLLHEAIGEQLTCIFVDNGLLREGEAESVVETFQRHFALDLRFVDAGERFLSKLEGVTDPEKKRVIIGHEFIDVFKEVAATLEDVQFLAQGTLYPDVIESLPAHGGPTATIKTHHNVGGLPAELGLELIEPLRFLFKDEVREMGHVIGMPYDLIWRHPFPGPGLGVRVVGEITKERLDVLRAADVILLDEIRAGGLYRKIAQAFAVLLPVGSVGVMGDERSYQSVVAIRCVETPDFMTADWVKMPYDVLGLVSNRIINEVKGVNRVVYDVSSKPPSTIEWE